MAFSPIQYFCLSGESGKYPIFLKKEIERISKEFDFE